MANPNWRPGVSGNPSGRPKKGRTWTDLLDKAGRRMLTLPDGSRVSAKRQIAKNLIDLALTTRTTLIDETVIAVADSEDWFNVIKFLYSQIDGPPKQDVDIDVSSGGKTIGDSELLSELIGILDTARARQAGAPDGAGALPVDTEGPTKPATT